MKIRDMQDYSANLALFKQHCKKAAKQYSESETPVCESEYTEEIASKIAEASGQPFKIPEESLEEVKNLKGRLAEKEQEVLALRQRVRDLDKDNAKCNDSAEKRMVRNVYIIKAKRISEQSKDGITWLEDENGTRFKIKAPYQKPLNTYGIPVEEFPFK